MSENNSKSEISNAYLLQKIKELEKKVRKNKHRRHKREQSRSRRREHTSRGCTRSRSRSGRRSRSVLSRISSVHSQSPIRNRNYRSPSGAECQNDSDSVDRSPREAAYAYSEADDHFPREVESDHGENNVAINTVAEAVRESPVLQIQDLSLTENWLSILGDDPNAKNQNNFELHAALATRWGHILRYGVEKEQKGKLLDRYILPINCGELTPPLINPEVTGVLSNPHLKRDQSYVTMQGQLNRGLTALGKGLGLILDDKENIPKELKEQLLTCLGDSSRILSDLSYTISTTRRFLIMPSLNKTVKDIVEKTVPENFLFGKELGEKIKEAKIIERARKDLKPEQTPASTSHTYKRTTNKYFQNSERFLNKKRPVRRGETKPQKGRYPRKDTYRQKKF